MLTGLSGLSGLSSLVGNSEITPVAGSVTGVVWTDQAGPAPQADITALAYVDTVIPPGYSTAVLYRLVTDNGTTSSAPLTAGASQEGVYYSDQYNGTTLHAVQYQVTLNNGVDPVVYGDWSEAITLDVPRNDMPRITDAGCAFAADGDHCEVDPFAVEFEAGGYTATFWTYIATIRNTTQVTEQASPATDWNVQIANGDLRVAAVSADAMSLSTTVYRVVKRWESGGFDSNQTIAGVENEIFTGAMP